MVTWMTPAEQAPGKDTSPKEVAAYIEGDLYGEFLWEMTPDQQWLVLGQWCDRNNWSREEVAENLADGLLAELAAYGERSHDGKRDSHSSGVNQPKPSAPRSGWSQAVAATGYDPNKFFVSASDVKGHGNTRNVKFPPEALRQIQELIATGAYPPYRLPGDFIRDAVHHHLRSRVEQVGDPAIRESNAEFFLLRDLEEHFEIARRMSQRWPDLRNQFNSICTQLARDRAWQQLSDQLSKTEGVVATATEPYRSAMVTEIDRWRKQLPAEFR